MSVWRDIIGTGDIKAVQKHIYFDADVNVKSSSGETALMEAAGRGWAEIVKALIDAGADVNAKTEYKKTALMWAAEQGRFDIVKDLVASGAEGDADELLECSLTGGNADIAHLFLRMGADVNKKDGWDITILMRAAKNKRTDIVKALIAAGADVNAKDNEGITVLQHARDKYVPGVKTLLKAHRAE